MTEVGDATLDSNVVLVAAIVEEVTSVDEAVTEGTIVDKLATCMVDSTEVAISCLEADVVDDTLEAVNEGIVEPVEETSVVVLRMRLVESVAMAWETREAASVDRAEVELRGPFEDTVAVGMLVETAPA